LCRFELEVVIQYSTAADDGLVGTTRAADGVDGGAGGSGVDMDDGVGDDTGGGWGALCRSKTNFLNTWFSCFKALFSDFNFSICSRISTIEFVSFANKLCELKNILNDTIINANLLIILHLIFH
jgi:hypothetical protein